MPPKAANTARRKGPAFNPPRPVKQAAQSTTTPGASTIATRPTARKPAATRSDVIPPEAMISSDDELEGDNDDPQSDPDEVMEDAVADFDRRQSEKLLQASSPISTPLLLRLLQQNFENERTQVQRGALELFEEYISLFVREAIARARDKRDQAAGRDDRPNTWLQVDDLEKLTPQLVLDF